MANSYPTLIPKADLAADDLTRFDQHVNRLPDPGTDWSVKQFDDYRSSLPNPEPPAAPPEPETDPLASFDAHVAGLPDPLRPKATGMPEGAQGMGPDQPTSSAPSDLTWQPTTPSAPELTTTQPVGGQTATSPTVVNPTTENPLAPAAEWASKAAETLGPAVVDAIKAQVARGPAQSSDVLDPVLAAVTPAVAEALKAMYPWEGAPFVSKIKPAELSGGFLEAALTSAPPIAPIASVAKPAIKAAGAFAEEARKPAASLAEQAKGVAGDLLAGRQAAPAFVGQAPETAPSVSNALLTGMGRGAAAGVAQDLQNPQQSPEDAIKTVAQSALLGGVRGVAGRVAPGAGLRAGQMAVRAAEQGGDTALPPRVPAVLPEIRTGGAGRLPPPPEGSPRLPGGGEIPPYQNPSDRLEELLNTKTAERPAPPGIGQMAKDMLGKFRRPTAEEAASKAEATGRLVRYDGDVARAIPREVGMEIRSLRQELAQAAGVREKVPTGAWSRAKATAEPVKADAFVDQRQKTALTLSLDDFAGEDVSVFLGELAPGVRLFRDKVRQSFDELGDLLVQKGILDPEDRKGNYISHIWALAQEGNPATAGKFTAEGIAIPKAYFEKERVFKTFEEGIKAGYVPATLDPLDLLEHFAIAAQRRVAGAELIDDIRHTNPDAVVFHTPGTPMPTGYQQIDHPFFRPQLGFGEAAPGLPAGPGGALSTEVRPTITVRRPEWVVRNDVAPLFNALFAPGRLRQWPVAKQALQVSASLKRSVLGAPLMLDMNMVGFESKALGYAVGVGRAKDIIRGAIRTIGRPDLHDAYLNQVVKMGTQSQTRLEWMRKLDEAGLTGSSYTSEVVRALGPETPRTVIGVISPRYERLQNIGEAMQFNDLIPKMKYEGALFLAGQKVKDGMPVEQALKVAANDMNKAMGGLNRIQLGRSQDFKDVMNFLLLSPDWAESRLRNFVSAIPFIQPGPSGAVARRAMARMAALGVASVVVGEGLYGGLNGKSGESITQSILARLTPIRRNQQNEPEFNPDFMTFRLPNGQRTTLLTWELDGLKLALGIGAYAAGDSETGDILAGRYAKARFGVLPRAALDLVRNQDWKEQPIMTSGNFWGDAAQFVAAETGGLTVPANVQTFGQVAQGLQSPTGASLTVSGLGRATAKQEMPDALRAALKANGLDDSRVSQIYELPPVERLKLEQNPEVVQFLAGRKTEQTRVRAVEQDTKARRQMFEGLQPSTRQILSSVGITGFGDAANQTHNVLLSSAEQLIVEAKLRQYVEAMLPSAAQMPGVGTLPIKQRAAFYQQIIEAARARANAEVLQGMAPADLQERVRLRKGG